MDERILISSILSVPSFPHSMGHCSIDTVGQSHAYRLEHLECCVLETPNVRAIHRADVRRVERDGLQIRVHVTVTSAKPSKAKQRTLCQAVVAKCKQYRKKQGCAPSTALRQASGQFGDRLNGRMVGNCALQTRSRDGRASNAAAPSDCGPPGAFLCDRCGLMAARKIKSLTSGNPTVNFG